MPLGSIEGSLEVDGVQRSSGLRSRFNLSLLRDYGIVAFLLALFIALTLSSSSFLTVTNLKNVVDGAVPVGLIACAGTLVIIAGGFDLSAGAIFAVAGIVGAKVGNDFSPLIGILAGLAAGCGLGLVNGIACTIFRINPFVGSIATSIVYTGLAVVLTGSGIVLITDSSFANLASTHFLSFKLSTWILVAFALFCGFLLNQTVFGRHLLARGGNVVAARLSGVPINRTLAATYVLSGGAAALAGLIVTARSLSASATSGSTIIFEALAAILIGGNSVYGGEGAIWRTIAGVFVLALINNGFNLLGVNPVYQQIVSGTIILVAVGADAMARLRTG